MQGAGHGKVGGGGGEVGGMAWQGGGGGGEGEGTGVLGVAFMEGGNGRMGDMMLDPKLTH